MRLSTQGTTDVLAARALLASLGMSPRVPASLVTQTDPERLLSTILATPRTRPSTTGTTGTTGTARHRRRTSVAAVAATTLLVALLAGASSQAAPARASTLAPLSYGLGDLAESAPGDLPDAGATLRGLAEAARTTPEPVRDGSVQHVVAHEWLSETSVPASGEAEATTDVYPTVTARWLAADGSGLVTQRRDAAVTYDGTIDTAAGPSPAGALASDIVAPGTFDDVARLPRDPGALAADLLGRSPVECSLDGWSGYCLTEAIQSTFGSGVVPQDLAGAFWEALSREPTVRLLGPTTDRAGRTGTAVAVSVPKIPDDPSTDESVLVVIVSGETGQMLSTETLTLHSDLLGITSPTVTGFSAVTVSEYTTEVGR